MPWAVQVGELLRHATDKNRK